MKLSTIVKIAVTSSVVLLCTGFALYSFFRLSSAENQKDFNLYSLVPCSATAIFETNNAVEFVAEVDELTCSKNQQYLYVSKLFSDLKQYLYTVFEEAPHGLSRQMNQVLISFHEPDNDRNQVLYCSLGAGDQVLVESFVQKYAIADYPPKVFNYKGEEITIYPMVNGDFLSCYLTSDFIALSYQKKLVEEVIDAYTSGNSLASDPAFIGGKQIKKTNSIANLYARLNGMIGWTEFNMKLKGDFIYFSGLSHDVDTCFTFINALRQQESVKGFSGDILPSATFYFSKQGSTDWPSLLAYSESQQHQEIEMTTEVYEMNKRLSRYLIENTGNDLITCMFQRKDSLMEPAAIMSLPVSDTSEAEQMLRPIVSKTSAFCYTPNKAYAIYALPPTTLFTQLTGFAEPASDVYVAFYNGRILFAPDADSLSLYIQRLEAGEVLSGALAYRAGTDGLSDSYHFMLMADFEEVFRQPETYIRVIPDFFFHNSEFFRHFVLFAQFSCADGVIYPNVVLKYKSDKE